MPSTTSGQDVLLIVVDPPKMGDPPFPCCKDLQFQKPDNKHSLQDGALYVRDRTNTRVAKGAEVTALHERGRAVTAPQVEISIDFAGTAVTLDDAPEVLEWWLSTTGQEYRDKRTKVAQEPPDASLVLPAAMTNTFYASGPPGQKTRR